jgi:hypothetical protein
MWSVVEPELAVVAACLPLMRPLFSKVARPWFGSSSHGISKSSRNGLTSDGTKKQFSRLNDSTASKNNSSAQSYALDTMGGGALKKNINDVERYSVDVERYTVGVEGGRPNRTYGKDGRKVGVEEIAQTLDDSDSGKSQVKILGRGAVPGGIRVQRDYSVEF